MSVWTLGFQVVNFLVLAVLLQRFLFKPVTAMIARRRQELEKVASDGQRARQEAEELRAQAERTAALAEETRRGTLGEARAQAERERGGVLADARREAQSIMEAGRRDLEAEREEAAATMAGRAVELATVIARRLLEQVATPHIAEAFLERLCQHLDSLPDERKRILREELGEKELLVATAPALGPEAAEHWLNGIAERMGRGLDVRVVGDDSLVAGAELRFPHTRLAFCWRDGLAAAREELARDAAAH